MLSFESCNWIVEFKHSIWLLHLFGSNKGFLATSHPPARVSHWITLKATVPWHFRSFCFLPFVYRPPSWNKKWIRMEVGVNRGFSLCCTFSDFQARYKCRSSPLIAETANYLPSRQFFFDNGEGKTFSLSHRFHSWLREKEEELHAPRAID